MAAGNGLHAAVLGLKAAALTAPYDVPIWLPDVLTALAAASSAPPPAGKVQAQTQQNESIDVLTAMAAASSAPPPTSKVRSLHQISRLTGSINWRHDGAGGRLLRAAAHRQGVRHR